MEKRKKVDWTVAKTDYITNKIMSLREVAEKYGVTYGYTRILAMREGWTTEKEKRWKNAEHDAVEEIEGSIKDLIVRHAKVARYLQAGGLKNLKLLLDEVEEKLKDQDANEETVKARKLLKGLIYNKIIHASTLTDMIGEGLKAERELYPKTLQIKGDIQLESEGLSKELEDAIYEAFKRRIRSKPAGSGKNSTKK